MNVVSLFQKAAKTYADRPALQYMHATFTYREVERHTDRIAAAMRRLGLSSGDRVVLWGYNRPELVELLIACWKASLVVVPINVRSHPREVSFVVGNCRAGALVYDSAFSESVAAIQEKLPPAMPRLQIGDDGWEAGGDPPLTIVERHAVRDPADEDLAWLFYTSGTTGRPKGAMLTHRNLMAMTMNCLADIVSFQPEDVVLHAAPLTHGSGMYLLPALARGSLNVISHQRSFEPRQIYEMVASSRVTVIAFLTPTMIVRLINDPAVRAYDLSSLRCVPYGGGPMYVEPLKAAIDLVGPIWVQLYGQGETPMTGTYLRCQEHRHDTPDAERRLGSAGITRTDMEVRIVGPEDDCRPDGEVGEIVLRGGTVMKGYWDNPSATQEALRDGWLHTGDLGYMDSEGYVYIVDRTKDMIISGGNNIYPREIEEVLLTHPKILEAAVIGIPDAHWGESVHAVISTRPGMTMRDEEVVEHCRAHLASYKKPRSVEFVEDLPKSAYGKVLKRELREKHWAGYKRRVGGGFESASPSGAVAGDGTGRQGGQSASS